jgi:hypothetical protein
MALQKGFPPPCDFSIVLVEMEGGSAHFVFADLGAANGSSDRCVSCIIGGEYFNLRPKKRTVDSTDSIGHLCGWTPRKNVIQ